MQAAVKQYAAEVRRTHGVPVHIRVGLNTGEVVVRAIGNDLHMDYTAVGQTTHLAARMEQLATPGTILLTPTTLRLVEATSRSTPGAGAGQGAARRRWRCLSWSGASWRPAALAGRRRTGAHPLRGPRHGAGGPRQALERAGAGMARWWRWSARPGVGKSRLVYEFVHSHRTQGWLRPGERLRVLRQGHPLSPGDRPAQALLPCRGPRRRRAPSGPRSPGSC